VRDDRFTYFNREEAQRTCFRAPTSRRCRPGARQLPLLGVDGHVDPQPGAPHNPADSTVSTVLARRTSPNVNVTSGFQNGWGILPSRAWFANGLVPTATSQRVSLAQCPGDGRGDPVSVTFLGLPVTAS
jgi:hypothetical protein